MPFVRLSAARVGSHQPLELGERYQAKRIAGEGGRPAVAVATSSSYRALGAGARHRVGDDRRLGADAARQRIGLRADVALIGIGWWKGLRSQSPKRTTEQKRTVSPRRKAAFSPLWPMQKVERKQQLGRLAPEVRPHSGSSARTRRYRTSPDAGSEAPSPPFRFRHS